MRNKKVNVIDTERVVLAFSLEVVAQLIEAIYREREEHLESFSFFISVIKIYYLFGCFLLIFLMA